MEEIMNLLCCCGDNRTYCADACRFHEKPTETECRFYEEKRT